MNKTHQFIEENRQRLLDELFDLLRIPSVSANPDFSEDVFEAAQFVADRLNEAGAEHVEVCPTAGYPVVYGERIVDPALPTVLVYGHYDVQPADPYELWHSPPFEPEIRDDKIYARGACDDKGQVYMHVKAFEYMMRYDALPCNIKFMIEGEEEVGSANLASFIVENRERLRADVVLISDTSMIANDVPSIDSGLRGLSYVEVEVTGPNRDLHSGVYGGAVTNPINALCGMIAQMHDAQGRITIPGFYDQVQELTQGERDDLNRAPFDAESYKKDLGIDALRGEEGYNTMERTGIRPTLDVNGIWGGVYGGRIQNGVTVQSLCQNIHAFGTPSDFGNRDRTVQPLFSIDRSSRGPRRGQASPWWRTGGDAYRQCCFSGSILGHAGYIWGEPYSDPGWW